MPKAVDQCVKRRLANPAFKAPKGSDKTRKEFAWALCQTLYKEGKLDGMSVEIEGQEYWSLDGIEWFARDEGNVTGFNLEPVTDADMEKLNRLLGAQTDKTEILKFSNAFLAREELNKNKDRLSRKNLEDIAKTLPLRAIDFEHREQEIVGLFIDAEVKGNGAGDGVSTDGIVYARRRPDVAMGLMKGELGLSIEADADSALCSMCKQVFKSSADYCSHLETRLQGSGAERSFPGSMVALGGAVTKSPAGTATDVPTESIVMIASQIYVEGGENPLGGKAPPKSYERIKDLVQDALNKEYRPPARAEGPVESPWVRFTFSDFVIIRSGGKLFKVPYKIKKNDVELGEWQEVEETFVEAMRKAGEALDEVVVDLWSKADEEIFFADPDGALEGKALTYKERQALKDSDFALIQKRNSKRIRRFPIHDCPRAANALQRLPQAKNLSSEEKAKIKRKAQAKLNSPACKSKTKGGDRMEELEKVQAELAEKVRALEALEGEKGDLVTKLAAAEKERDDFKADLEKEKTAHKRELELLAYLKPERIEEQREAIEGMNDEAFTLFLESLKGTEEHKAGILGHVPPGSEDPSPDPSKEKAAWVTPE